MGENVAAARSLAGRAPADLAAGHSRLTPPAIVERGDFPRPGAPRGGRLKLPVRSLDWTGVSSAALEADRSAANRRRHRRVEVAGIATVTSEQGALTVWVVQDLSQGGLSLVGDALLIPGQHVPLTLHLPGQEPLALRARVLRRQLASRRGRTAMAFEALTDAQTRAVTAAVEQNAPRDRSAPRVAILVARPSASSTTIAPLERELIALGLAARVASHPLDGAAWLQKEAGAAALLVDERLVEHKGWNLLDFTRETRPQVRRLVVASRVHGFGTDVSLRTGQADAVLERPFTAALLASRLGPALRRRTRR
jgi:hypothetical protein